MKSAENGFGDWSDMNGSEPELTVREIDASQREYWDREVAQFENVHPLNAFGWGQVRAVDGWSPAYYMAKRGQTVTGAIMVLTKQIPFCGLSIMYAPRGPVFRPSDRQTLKVLLDRIRTEARKNRAIFFRIDPHLREGEIPERADPFVQAGLLHLKHRWSYWNTPRDVYRIDLTQARNEEELFLLLNNDARRCVRKSRKDGLVIRAAESLDELKEFYAVYSEFTIKKGFMSRGFLYQRALWDEFISRGRGRLFLAVCEGKIIGGIINLMFGRKCLDMHMGTPYQYRKLQSPYAYVWESIKWAKENGCFWYSFRGVGATPSQEFFKRKFSPEVIALAG
ncbi:MAG: peptidoglycan bridge formation glycyltransferase FemA/FemB family protein, partial [Desulfobacteraceae bacterium]